MTDPQPTPVIAPIIALLRSRKAMTALIAALISLAVPFAPGLEAQRDNLLTIALILCPVLASVLVASTAYEDGKEKGAPTTINAPAAGDTNIAPPVLSTDTTPFKPYTGELPHD